MTAGAATVKLLGKPEVQLRGQREVFVTDKRFRLLGFLAYHGDWVSRAQLAYLFWPDSPDEAARSSLRQLLKRVRTLPWLKGLDAERDRVRWQVSTDLAAFTRALSEEDLPSALALYQGPLLQRLEEGAEETFLDWLELERGRLQNVWRDALLRRASQLDAAGAPGEAAELLKHLLGQDPLDEEALRSYMSAALRAGQEQRALYTYRTFTKRLKLELGLEPASVTQVLARALFEASQVAAPAGVPALAAAARLPAVTTPFLGRSEELSEAVRLLRSADCRLLTLLGPGGVGKSRLALQVAQALSPHFSDGLYYLSLEYARTPEAVVFALAATIRLELQGPEEPSQQLYRWFGDKDVLLVLDNYEHLLPDLETVLGLCEACPKLKLLITSRVRLDLAEAWVIPISGLPYPRHPAPLEEAAGFPAVQLFVERARRVQAGFSLTEEALPYILKICDLLDGLPLGLELAAAWVRMMPCAALAEEIENTLDFIHSSSRNASERHKSLRATFDHSWRLLVPKEQEVLRGLAVFQGGFVLEAAALVAGAPVAVLGALVDKSLLQFATDGKYRLHPVLHGYLQEKLAERPEDESLVRQRHGSYYLHLLAQQVRVLKGPDEVQARTLIQEELENVRTAWAWAVALGKVRELTHGTEPLMLFFDLQARYEEGISMLQGAAAALTEDRLEHRPLLGLLRVAQACLYPWLGAYAKAAELAQSGLPLLRDPEDSWGALVGNNTLGLLGFVGGDFQAAERHWHHALTFAEALGDPYATAEVLSSLALVAAWQGQRQEAARYVQKVLPALRHIGNHRSAVYCLFYTGVSYVFMDSARDGQELLQQGLNLAQEIDERRYIPHLLYSLAVAAFSLGELRRAQALCEEALAKAEKNGDRFAQVWALAYASRIDLWHGDLTEAQGKLMRCLALALETTNLLVAPLVVVLYSTLQLKLGKSKQVRGWLRAACHAPSADPLSRAAAERLLATLGEAATTENAPAEPEDVGRILKKMAQALTHLLPE